MQDTKWILTMGCHRGTITSRDVRMPQSFDTRDEAITEYQKVRAGWQQFNYQVWYADLVDPNGKSETLESNPYY